MRQTQFPLRFMPIVATRITRAALGKRATPGGAATVRSELSGLISAHAIVAI